VIFIYLLSKLIDLSIVEQTGEKGQQIIINYEGEMRKTGSCTLYVFI